MSKTFKKNKRAVKRKFAELEDDMMADERAMMGSLKRGKTGFDVLQNALSEHADRLSPSQLQWIKGVIKRKYSKGIDLGYLKTVLFPEFFSYDIPQPLTNLAYCRFDDKQDATINTGASGSGMLLWFPRVTQGPSVFYMPCGAVVQGGTSPITLPTSTPIPFATQTYTAPGAAAATTATALDNKYWRYGFWKGYEKCFTQTNLVAASLSLQYIGQIEQESGIWIGAHIYGQTPNQLVLDDIENGQYVTKRRPQEGLRFVHLPMDAHDYEYYPTHRYNAHNAGTQATSNESTFMVTSGKTSGTGADTPSLDLSTSTTSNIFPGVTTTTPEGYAETSGIMYASNTNYVAIYWTGLPKNQEWIRLDATRRFNGIPKQAYRDVVNVTRCKTNYDAKKTFDVLRQLCINTPVGGHSLKEVDQQMDRIVANLPNVVPMVDSGTGAMTQIRSMEELAGALEGPVVGSEPRMVSSASSG